MLMSFFAGFLNVTVPHSVLYIPSITAVDYLAGINNLPRNGVIFMGNFSKLSSSGVYHPNVAAVPSRLS